MIKQDHSVAADRTIDLQLRSDVAWFVARLAPDPRRLGSAERFAAAFDIETFAPRLRRAVKRQIRRPRQRPRIDIVEVETLVLPGYLLVCLPSRDFGALDNAEATAAGFRGFVGGLDGPRRIPHDIVEELRAREADGEFDLTRRRGRRTTPHLPTWVTPGREVRIAGGPLEGRDACIKEVILDVRAKVAMALLGRQTIVEMEIDDLRDKHVFRG